MKKELIVELKYDNERKGLTKPLRSIDDSIKLNNSMLYIEISIIEYTSKGMERGPQSFKVWLGHELTYEDFKKHGLGRKKRAQELFEKNPKVRFVVPKRNAGNDRSKPEWFPLLIDDWEVLGEYDVVKSNIEDLKLYLLQLKQEQEKIFNRREKENKGYEKVITRK